jgi:hypothetical protein
LNQPIFNPDKFDPRSAELPINLERDTIYFNSRWPYDGIVTRDIDPHGSIAYDTKDSATEVFGTSAGLVKTNMRSLAGDERLWGSLLFPPIVPLSLKYHRIPDFVGLQDCIVVVVLDDPDDAAENAYERLIEWELYQLELDATSCKYKGSGHVADSIDKLKRTDGEWSERAPDFRFVNAVREKAQYLVRRRKRVIYNFRYPSGPTD